MISFIKSMKILHWNWLYLCLHLYYASYNTFKSRILEDIAKKCKNKFNKEKKHFLLKLTMASKKTTIKILRKWEEQLESKFLYDLNSNKVCHIWCNICIKWEQHKKCCKNFSSDWIIDSVSKDSVKKHVESMQHKEAKH